MILQAVVPHANDDRFEVGLRATYFGDRNLGVAAATSGEFGAHMIRAAMLGVGTVRHSDDVELLESVMPGEFPTAIVDGPRSEAKVVSS